MASIIRTDLVEDSRVVTRGDRVVVGDEAAYTVDTLTVTGAFEVRPGARVDVGHLVNDGTVVNRGQMVARRLDNGREARFENRAAARIGSAHTENENHGVIASLAGGALVLLATRNRDGASIRSDGSRSVLRIDGVIVNEPGAEITSRSAATIEVGSGVYSAGLILNGRGCVLRTISGVQVRNYAGGVLRNRGAMVNRGRIIGFGGQVRLLGATSGHPIEHETETALPY